MIDDEDEEVALCWVCGIEIDECDDDGTELCPDCAADYEEEEGDE